MLSVASMKLTNHTQLAQPTDPLTPPTHAVSLIKGRCSFSQSDYEYL